MLPDSATAALSDLHADFVQGWKSLQQNTGIELSLVYGRRLSVQTKQRVDHRLRGANGILNCEHRIVCAKALYAPLLRAPNAIFTLKCGNDCIQLNRCSGAPEQRIMLSARARLR
jgi:hypothetical protein